jgi:hypothetical protein
MALMGECLSGRFNGSARGRPGQMWRIASDSGSLPG